MSALKEHGLLFTAPMVRAILAGQKTQTRRILKSPHVEDAAAWCDDGDGTWTSGVAGDYGRMGRGETIRAPHGPVGRRLYVKETYGLRSHTDVTDWYRKSIKGWKHQGLWAIDYRADWGPNDEACFWRPSIHMPRWASRITLEVTRVRVERVGDISEEDARAEGVDWAAPYYTAAELRRRLDEDDREDPREVGYSSGSFARQNYVKLWDEINGAGSFAASPWVWVYDFRRVG